MTPPVAPSLFLADLNAEAASTRRMLAAFPDAHADWRPHEKSRTLAALATHVARLPLDGVNVLTLPELDIANRTPRPSAATSADLLREFEEAFAPLKAAAATITADGMAEPCTLRRGATVLATAPRAAMVRILCLSDLIHHRAQLGVYYRLLSVPVPGMYGPSADE